MIYDRIVLADAAKAPCWLLHSLREPRASGPERALIPEAIGPQYFWNGKERVPHPNPGGHTAMAGEMFTVESGSPAKPGGGWLAVRTLAPSVGDFERRKIGGKDHDFEVAGVQYGLTDEGYQMAESPYAVRSTIGLLGWRVELRPKTPSRTVEFLHLLQVGVDGQTPSILRDARHESTPDTHQITLRPGDQQIVLRLNRTGP